MSMHNNSAPSNSDTGATPRQHVAAPLIPPGLAFLTEERPLLWYEDAEEYDALRREIFAELAPEAAIECILVKDLVDYIWEARRAPRLKTAAKAAGLGVASFPLTADAARLERRRFRGSCRSIPGARHCRASLLRIAARSRGIRRELWSAARGSRTL